MYKILGADQLEYGPVTTDQMAAWIREGRANAQTLVKAEGTTDWKPLADFVELAPLLAAAPAAAPPVMVLPPTASQAAAESLTAQVLSKPVIVGISYCFGRAWDLYVANFWPLVAVSAVMTLILSVVNGLYVGLLLNGPLLGGFSFYALKLIRRQPTRFEDAFAGFTIGFVPLMLASLVSELLTLVGLLLCILPGLYLMVAWGFAYPLIMDRRLDFWNAMEVSRKVANAHFFPLCILLVLSCLLNLAGSLLLCVGVVFTLPLTVLAWMYAYEDLFGSSEVQ